MTCGIYYYWDNKNDTLAYIGKSINCEKRHKAHLSPSRYNAQPFNKILQKNPYRFDFAIMLPCCKNKLNEYEKQAISMYKPRFNFTIGGDGCGSGENHPFYGQHHTLEHCQMMSQKMSGDNNPMYNKNHTEKTKKQISNKLKGKNNPFYGKRHSAQLQEQISLHRSQTTTNTGYYRVSKKNSKSCRQGFIWQYRYTDEHGKRKTLMSVDLDKLKEKVLKRKLKWYKF